MSDNQPLSIKDPAATLDYGWDWSAWLGDDDTILTSTWTAPEGIEATDSTHNGAQTTVWVTGGTAGEDYDVVNRIESSGGRIDERTITIMVRNR